MRRILRGPADDSYGIEVAKLAGIPDSVVTRAKEVLKGIESGENAVHTPASRDCSDDFNQLTLLSDASNPIIAKLKAIDVNTLTPIEALQQLYALCKEANTF